MKNNMSNRTVSKLFIELLYKKGVRYLLHKNELHFLKITANDLITQSIP